MFPSTCYVNNTNTHSFSSPLGENHITHTYIMKICIVDNNNINNQKNKKLYWQNESKCCVRNKWDFYNYNTSPCKITINIHIYIQFPERKKRKKEKEKQFLTFFVNHKQHISILLWMLPLIYARTEITTLITSNGEE